MLSGVMSRRLGRARQGGCVPLASYPCDLSLGIPSISELTTTHSGSEHNGCACRLPGVWDHSEGLSATLASDSAFRSNPQGWVIISLIKGKVRWPLCNAVRRLPACPGGLPLPGPAEPPSAAGSGVAEPGEQGR